MPSSSPHSPTSSEIGHLKRQNLVRDFRKFDTRFSYNQVREEVKKLFPDHLQDPDQDFRICRKEGKFLNTADLRDGEELGGNNLKKFSHIRKIFIIPSKDLNIYDNESDDSVEPIRKEPYRNRQTPVRYGSYVMNQSELLSYYDTPLCDREIDRELKATLKPVVPDDMERIKEILQPLQPDPSVGAIKIYATRGAIINSGIAFLIDEVNNLKNKQLRICFTDLVGIEEEASDWGGPRREFFDQLVDEALDLPIFIGEMEKSLNYDEEHLSKQTYYFVFLLFGLSIIQGGAPPNFLSKYAFNKIIATEELQEENLNEAYEQIKNGLTAVGLLEIMRKEPILFEKLFTLGPSLPSFEKFEALIKFNRSTDVDSEDFKVESNIIMLWQRLLLKVQKNQTPLSLAHILSFASGTKRLPALGFDKVIDVSFNHANPDVKFPFGATCGLQILLPVKVHKLEDFDDFATAMVEGIRNSLGMFGRR